ncbi:MAG: DUF1559 domain-containing protein [Planctomycetia bacterium]|nr:DUF1559 domain-containing protein [Planctomycetia bacterium]
MRQIGPAIHMYHDSNRTIPHGLYVATSSLYDDRSNLLIALLPHCEQKQVWDCIDRTRAGGISDVTWLPDDGMVDRNRWLMEANVPIYTPSIWKCMKPCLCPLDGAHTGDKLRSQFHVGLVYHCPSDGDPIHTDSIPRYTSTYLASSGPARHRHVSRDL